MPRIPPPPGGGPLVDPLALVAALGDGVELLRTEVTRKSHAVDKHVGFEVGVMSRYNELEEGERRGDVSKSPEKCPAPEILLKINHTPFHGRWPSLRPMSFRPLSGETGHPRACTGGKQCQA